MDALFAAWDLSTFLTNSATSVEGWISLAVIPLGLICAGYGVFLGIRKAMSEGRAQYSWFRPIGCLLLGVVCVTGGFSWIMNAMSGTTTTIEQLGNGTGGFFLFF